MYKHILIATDGSDLARKALADGLELAKGVGARVTIVVVTEPWATDVPAQVMSQPFVQEFERAAADRAQAILESAAVAAKDAKVEFSTLHVRDRYPSEGILEAAKAGCDLIVMASHGRRGVARFVLGSAANEVVTQSKVPVLVCR
jgi:nucleotide-binding universal stress UspA family protein